MGVLQLATAALVGKGQLLEGTVGQCSARDHRVRSRLVKRAYIGDEDNTRILTVARYFWFMRVLFHCSAFLFLSILPNNK